MRSKMTIVVSIYGLFQIATWILWWMQNELVAKGFCCGYTHSIQRILFNETGETGIFSWIVSLLFSTIPHEKTPLIFVGVVYLLTGLYLWKKTERNLLCVLMYFSMPAPFVAAHRFDFYVFGQMTLFFFWFLFQNRNISILQIPLLTFVFLVPYLSARSTDNILLLGAIGSFAFLKHPLLLTLCVGLLFSVLQVADGSGFTYYQSEYSLLSTFDYFQITTYGSYLFWRGVGMIPFSIVIMFAVMHYAKIPKGIWFWIVSCYVVLTLTTKKNHYYVFVLWPVFPLMIHYTTQHIKNTKIYTVSTIVLVLWSVLLQLSLFPQNPFHNSISLIKGNSRWGGVFQTADGNLDAATQENNWADIATSRIQNHLPTGTLWCSTSIPIDELSLRLWTRNRVHIKNLTEKNKSQLKKGDAAIVAFQERMRFPDFEQMTIFYDHQGRIYVYLQWK